ncbi:serine/arginine repetitive matrix protein 1-like [Pongo pygmaeus]|uniref:serine/arginine repetitive matrix protein 1-like n=1 Tax=Pongo pygmaeus TaxID=9600 RepID=UPI00300D21B2
MLTYGTRACGERRVAVRGGAELEVRPAGEPGWRLALSLPPSHREGQGRRPPARVTRPSCPITGLCQDEAGRRGRSGSHRRRRPHRRPLPRPPAAEPGPSPVPLTCQGRRRRRHRGLNRSRAHTSGVRQARPLPDVTPLQRPAPQWRACSTHDAVGRPALRASELPRHRATHTRSRPPGPQPRERPRDPSRARRTPWPRLRCSALDLVILVEWTDK